MPVFAGAEIMNGILSAIQPDEITSINQLHGEKRGIIRITMKTKQAAMNLDKMVNQQHPQSAFDYCLAKVL